MSYMAQWGPKGFAVSPSQIVALQNLTTSITLKTDSENDTSGTAPTNTRGLELQPVTFSATYRKATGSNPRVQWEEWKSLVGQKYPLYVGGNLFGPASLILQGISASAIDLSDTGEMTAITIDFTFEEDAMGQTSPLVGMSALDPQRMAMTATASPSDKARLFMG